MMLTIQGLPRYLKYNDLKVLVKEKCNITDFFFDNLVDESETTKKVRIALVQEKDGVHLYNCLDGFQMAGHMLRVAPVRNLPLNTPNTINQENNYPQRHDFPSNAQNTNRPVGRLEPAQNQTGFMGRSDASRVLGSSNVMQSRPDVVRGYSRPMGGPDVLQAGADSMRAMSGPLGRSDPMQGRIGHAGRPDSMQNRSMAGQADRWEQGSGQWSSALAPNSQHNSYSHHPNAPGNASFEQQPKWQLPVQGGGYKFQPTDVSQQRQTRGDGRAHVLRSVEIIDEPLSRPIEVAPLGRPPVDAMTISKDNFQGPQLGLDRQPSSFPPSWANTASSQDKDPYRPSPYTKPEMYKPGYGRKYPDPAGDKRPKDDPLQYNKGPRFSPRRDILLPPTRRDSLGRAPSPGRRVSPISSDRRRAESPQARYGSRDKYPPSKDVRPAYDGGPVQAPNQAMYSGGYRPNLQENMPYPVPGGSQESSWQDSGAFAKKEEDRRDSRGKFEREDGKRSPHASRSPMRRPLERSPPRDRYVKRSVSPRSPRRSWALEKRRSPDQAPPPPMWPGQPPHKRNYSGDDKKRGPIWERPPYHDKPEHERGPTIPDKRFEGTISVKPDFGRAGITEHPHSLDRDSLTRGKPDDRMPQREPVFEPRQTKFEPRREPQFEPRREPDFEPRREPHFEPRKEPHFELRKEPHFAPRKEPHFEPRKDPHFEPRKEPHFEPRKEPHFEPRKDPHFEPRKEPHFEPRKEPHFEPRKDPHFEPRKEPHFEPRRQPHFEPRKEPHFEPRKDPHFEPRKDPHFEPRKEPHFEPRKEPHFETRRDPKFGPRETSEPKFEPREPVLEPKRDPKFALKDPKFERQLGPKFEPRGPTFEPRRDPKFESRDVKFEPKRDPNFERRDPNFKVREPQQGTRGLDSREHNLPRFEPRTDFEESEHRKKMARLYLERNMENRQEKQASDRDVRDVCQPDSRRYQPERREEEKKLPKAADFNKEFDDVYKRSLEFKQKVDEVRRRSGERRKEGFDDGRSDGRRQGTSRSDDRRPDDRHSTHDERRPVAKDEPQPGGWAGRAARWSGEMKAKREKAIEDVCKKLMEKYSPQLLYDQRRRVYEEVKKTVTSIFLNMFEDTDVSFIEMVVKFNARYEGEAEVKLFRDVMSGFPSSYRKRLRPDVFDEPNAPAAKAARLNEDNLTRDGNRRAEHVPDWSAKTDPQQVSLLMQQFDIVPQMMLHPGLVGPGALGGAVPLVLSQMSMQQMPGASQPASLATVGPQPTFTLNEIDESSPAEEIADESFYLYLCRDDFEPYTFTQAEYLKKYLVNQIITASESASGWTPDFTLKGLQSLYRYELVARDEATRDWIINLDFSDFSFFNVLVYTKEELWYERAAIWLPGHSKARNIEPLVKLELQNRYVEGVNIGKWKLVKKIVTAKGTRLYVEMPPSSARALEKHKMELSYELQKVSVFLKAVAVDKDAFDMGLKDISVTDDTVILNAIQTSPMPSIGNDPNVVKFALKGNKPLNLVQARKIKEMIIYRIFKYIQDKGTRKTDFVKYGFCLPGYLAVLPENSESRRWLEALNLGKIYKHAIVVLGAEEANTKMIRMSVIVSRDIEGKNGPLILERLKLSNQGVKGLHFNLWKVVRLYTTRHNKLLLEVDMDVDSIDTLSKMSYRLDYVDGSNAAKSETATVRYDGSYSKLEEQVRMHLSEQSDSYDVANMELASDLEEDDDIICMGEVK